MFRPSPALALPLLAIVGASLVQLPLSGQAPALRGFSSEGLAAQRALEDRFRAVPDAARLREYMQAMSAEPHVAGRPGSKKVADYALEKSFGLNATIEELEAYMPWPIERRLEIVAPTGRAMPIQGSRRSRAIPTRSTTIRRPPTTPTRPTATSPVRWST